MALIIAHRGFSGKYPENTMLAIRKAIELGVDGVEFDVRATKDGKLVLFHDKKLKRLTGVSGSLNEKSYAQIRKLKVSGREKIPLLSDAFRLLARSSIKMVNAEIKGSGAVEGAYQLGKRYGLLDRIVFSSFDSADLVRLRSLDRNTRLAYLLDNRPDKIRKWKSLHKKIGLYSVNPFHERPIHTGRFVRSVHKRGVKVMPWFLLHSSKQNKRMPFLMKIGVDGIITDYPDTLKKIMAEKKH